MMVSKLTFIEYFLSARHTTQCFTRVTFNSPQPYEIQSIIIPISQGQSFKSLFIYYFLQMILNTHTCFLFTIVLPCMALTLGEPRHMSSPYGTQTGKHRGDKQCNYLDWFHFQLVYVLKWATLDCWPGLTSHSSRQLFHLPHLPFLTSLSPDDFPSNII